MLIGQAQGNMQKRRQYFFELLLLLFGMNAFRAAAVLGIVIFVYCLYQNKYRIQATPSMILLMLASVSFFIMYMFHYGIPPIRIIFSRMLGVIVLLYAGNYMAKQGIYMLWRGTLALALGFALHGVGNIYVSRGINIVTLTGRAYNDMWGGILASTGQTLLFIMICSCFFYFLFMEKNKILKILGISLFAVGVIGAFSSGTRTLLLLVAISLVLSTFLYMSNFRNVSRKVQILLMLLLLVVLVLFAVNQNLFGLKDWLAGSGLSVRFKGSEGDMWSMAGRTGRWDMALKRIIEQPMGNIDAGTHAHNLWFDIAFEVGVIPALFYLLFSIRCVFIIIKTIKNKAIKREYIVALIPILVCMFAVMFVEPILQGNPYFYMSFCYIIGGLEILSRLRSEEEINATF